MQNPEGRLAEPRFASRFTLVGVILIAAIIEAKAAYHLFFNPGMAEREFLDYLMLLLILIPASMAIVSRGETRKWASTGDMSPIIAATIDGRMTVLAMVSCIIMIAMRETIH